MSAFNDVEQVKAAETAEAMRGEIFRLKHYDPLVRNVMCMADYRGMSAEDRYTILAYEALRQLNHIKQLTLNDAMLNPAPPILRARDGATSPD